MKNYEYWKQFINSGKIDDYLNYIACTSEEYSEEITQTVDRESEGGFSAGINYRDGNGSVGHTGWRL